MRVTIWMENDVFERWWVNCTPNGWGNSPTTSAQGVLLKAVCAKPPTSRRPASAQKIVMNRPLDCQSARSIQTHFRTGAEVERYVTRATAFARHHSLCLAGAFRSCPDAWCSFWMATTIAGQGRACQ